MEIRINKDIRRFKTKDIGAFSFKEAGFTVGACAAGYGTYFLLTQFNPEMTIEDSVPVALIPMALILAFGFLKPYGLTMAQFMRTYFMEYFMSPQIYVWENDFEFDLEKMDEIWGEEYKYNDERLRQIADDFVKPPVETLSKEEIQQRKMRQEEIRKMQIT